jgi:glucokinase
VSRGTRTAGPVGGIDLGGTKIQTAIVGGRGRVLGEARRATPTSGGPEDVAEQMAEALREAAENAGIETPKLGGVGVGSPGDVDGKSGNVSSARNLPGWEGSFPLAAKLSEALGTPVRVGNDVQVATDAEAKLGAGQPYDSLLGVFWGTGVGGGLILDGRPWLGRGAAGEIGHTVVKRGGARCPCGRRGCLEAYAGRAAMEEKARRAEAAGTKTDLFKIMRERGRDRLTSGIWERALHKDDALAGKLIDRAVRALGAGIGSAVNLLDVEAVIIGGGLGLRFGEPYVKRIEKHMAKHLFVPERPPAVHLAALGDLGGAIGASLLFQGNQGLRHPPRPVSRSLARDGPQVPGS